MAYYNNRNNNYQQNLKPEAVLEQAIALDSVGKASDALTLMKPIYIQRNSGKPMQRPWSQALEDLTIKFVELSVKTKADPHLIKPILTSFRNSCVSVSATSATTNHPQSVVRVVKFLLQCVEKTINFQHLSIDPDDDDEDTPEAFAKLALAETTTSTSASIQEQQRKNKTAASLRAYWQYYLSALDTVRPSRPQSYGSTPPPTFYPLFRALYEDILRHIFETTGKYNLIHDFRRQASRSRYVQNSYLSSMNSLSDLLDRREAIQNQFIFTLPHDIDQLSETYSLMLTTRLYQLNSAIALQSWVETSATFNDITDILSTITDQRSLVTPTVILMQQRFLDFLWDGGNTFLHACALKVLYDRLIIAESLYGQDKPTYINDLLTEVQKKATDFNFPKSSWAFASFDTIKNGIILSTILAQSTSIDAPTVATSSSSSQNQSSAVFGGLSTSPSDQPISSLNTHSFYVTSQEQPSLNSLFAHATGVAALSNAELVKTRTHQVDPSFIMTQQTNVQSNLEVFKYISFLSIDSSTEPTVQNLIDYVNTNFSLSTSSTTPLYSLFTNLTNKTLTPLRLNKLIAPYLTIISQDVHLQQYNKPLYHTIVRTILSSLSNIYTVITLDKFIALLPPSPYATDGNDEKARIELELIITKISSAQNLSIKIDHSTSSLHLRPFPRQIEQRVYSILGSVATAMDCVVKPLVQQIMDPQKAAEYDYFKPQFFEMIRQSMQNDVEIIRARHVAFLEARKQRELNELSQRERIEMEAKAKQEQHRIDQEAKLAEIKAKRESDQQKKSEDEAKSAKKKQMQELISKQAREAQDKNVQLTKEMKKQLAKLETNADGKPVKELSEHELIELAKKVEIQKKREFLRLKKEQKKLIDYTVRALRLAQREKLLEQKQQKMAAIDNEMKATVEKFQQQHKEQWENDINKKKSLTHVFDAHAAYKAKIMADRKVAYNEQMAEWNVKHAAYEAEQAKIKEEAKKAQEKAIQAKKLQEAELQRQKEEERAKFKETIPDTIAPTPPTLTPSQSNYRDDDKGFKQPRDKKSKFLSGNTSTEGSVYQPRLDGAPSRNYDDRPPRNNGGYERTNDNGNAPKPSKFSSQVAGSKFPSTAKRD